MSIHDELTNRFTYHAPKGDQAERYATLRAAALEFARAVVRLCPAGSRRSRALDKIDEAMMLANAAIARGE